MNSITNRWGRTITVNDTVRAHSAQGDKITGKVLSIDTRSRFARAYGAQLKLDAGYTIGADDVFAVLLIPPGHPEYIDASKYDACRRPGKFECQSPATEYFYEQMCNGDGETIYAAVAPDGDNADEDDYGDEPSAELFQIDVAESEAFGIPHGQWFMLCEDSQGFALGSVHATREAAEKAFTNWTGS